MKTSTLFAISMVVLVGLCVLPGRVVATELIWVPVNPSFGGYAGNASWLMSSAQIQNKFQKQAEPYKVPERDMLEDFASRLNSQLLYQLANKIVGEAFGEEGLLPADQSEAHYTVGTFQVDVTTNLANIMVTLSDTSTGNTTIVEVPYY